MWGRRLSDDGRVRASDRTSRSSSRADRSGADKQAGLAATLLDLLGRAGAAPPHGRVRRLHRLCGGSGAVGDDRDRAHEPGLRDDGGRQHGSHLRHRDGRRSRDLALARRGRNVDAGASPPRQPARHEHLGSGKRHHAGPRRPGRFDAAPFLRSRGDVDRGVDAAGFADLLHDVDAALDRRRRRICVAGTYNTGQGTTYPNFIYRSADDGRTWSIASTTTTHRHIHGLRYDAPSHTLFVFFGDSPGDGVWQSSDNGAHYNRSVRHTHASRSTPRSATPLAAASWCSGRTTSPPRTGS